MLERGRLLGRPFSGGLAGWCVLLIVEVALLRLVYPIAVVLVEQAWAGSALVLATLSIGLSALRGLTADRVTRMVRGKLFDALTTAIEDYPALPPPGAPPIEQLESEIAKGVPWVEAMVAVTVPSIVGNAVTLPIIAWLSWVRVGTRATLIASAALTCGATLGAFIARQVGRLGTIAWDSYQPVARLIESGFRGRVELGIHLRSRTHREGLRAAVARWSVAERRLFVWGSVAGRLVPAATALSALAIAALAGYRPLALMHQVMDQPSRSVVAASLLALTALPVLIALARGIADWSTEWPHLNALALFVGLARGEKPSPSAHVSGDSSPGSIRAERVRFQYPGRRAGEPGTVVEASVVWESGETLAIGGTNGSGKTTLTWLLMGIIEPDAGTVVVEMDGRVCPPSALAGRIAYLPQQPYFEELQSVDDAIRFIAPNATDTEIRALVSTLLEDRFVGDVRTLLDRNVMSLSVGERRVVALARVLLRKSQLVILDEPEANLDGLLRQRVMKALRDAKSDCRMLIVSHDDAFVAIADRVYRMPSKR
ncbi:MAG: ATP-binding cassette domain-containing protein [Pseudomonadota bacterium]